MSVFFVLFLSRALTAYESRIRAIAKIRRRKSVCRVIIQPYHAYPAMHPLEAIRRLNTAGVKCESCANGGPRCFSRLGPMCGGTSRSVTDVAPSLTSGRDKPAMANPRSTPAIRRWLQALPLASVGRRSVIQGC